METPFEITGNKITLKNYKDNKAAYTISFGFMYFCAAMPFIILTILLSSGFKVGGGFIFSFVLFGSIAYFFYRIATWNKFGIEHFTVTEDQLIYHPEAKSLSFQKREFNKTDLKLTLNRTEDTVLYNGERQNLGKIGFHTSNMKFENNLRTPVSVLREILQHLEKSGITVEMDFEELHD
jgi:hypothetical protein